MNDEGSILCENTGGGIEHGTDPVSSPCDVIESKVYKGVRPQPGSMRKLLLQYPDLSDTQRSRQQQPSGTLQLFFERKGGYKVERQTVVSSFSCTSPELYLVYPLDQVSSPRRV